LTENPPLDLSRALPGLVALRPEKTGQKSHLSLRCAKDKNFRKLALENPAEAVKQIAGKQVPSGFKLKLIEGDPKADMTVVIPELKVAEISDAELEKVAGGLCAHACAADRSCA